MKRAEQRFTAIQAVALAELDGASVPNAYGDLPPIEKDPARPAVTPGSNPNNAWALHRAAAGLGPLGQCGPR